MIVMFLDFFFNYTAPTEIYTYGHTLPLLDALTIGAGQPLRPAHPRGDAELDLGLAELRGIGGQDEIGHHRKLAAAAQRKARDCRDPRLAGGGDPGRPSGEEILKEGEIGRAHV